MSLNPDWTVFSGTMNAVLQASEHLGASCQKMLTAVGIDREQLTEPDNRFPVSQYYQLVEMAIEETGDRNLGLYVGRISYTNGLNLQLYMSTICDTFRDYLNLMPSVLKFAGDTGELIVRSEGDLLRLEWVPLLPETNKKRYLSDTFLASASIIANSLCIRPINVIKAEFSYPRPEDVTLLQETFGDDLSFDRPVSCLYLRRETLDYPVSHLDFQLSRDLSEQVQHLFDDQKAGDVFLKALRESIVRLLPSGRMTISGVAGDLNVSKRTLQRRLSDRGTQFQQVVQEIRQRLSKRYIADERLSLAEAAFLLGYSDQSSFTSAFKTWHGCSPGKFRSL